MIPGGSWTEPSALQPCPRSQTPTAAAAATDHQWSVANSIVRVKPRCSLLLVRVLVSFDGNLKTKPQLPAISPPTQPPGFREICDWLKLGYTNKPFALCWGRFLDLCFCCFPLCFHWNWAKWTCGAAKSGSLSLLNCLPVIAALQRNHNIGNVTFAGF